MKSFRLTITTSVIMLVAFQALPAQVNVRKYGYMDEPITKSYSYVGIDGNKHEMLAYFPEDHQPTDKRPVFVFFHGGGWKSGKLTQGMRYCEYMAARGIVGLTVDYSMHLRADGPPDLEEGESRKRICVIDAKTVIRWVKTHADDLGIDPQQIIASGFSAGAHIATVQMFEQNHNNPADPEEVNTDVQALVLLGSAFTMPENDNTPEMNAFQFVDQPFPPALFLCGDEDRWSVASQELARQLSARKGNEIEFWLGQGGHKFFGQTEETRDATIFMIDRFLRDHGFLTGEPIVSDNDSAGLRRINF